MRPLLLIPALVILAACHSSTPIGPTVAQNQKTSSKSRIVVGDILGTGHMIHQPRPVYPTEAKKARIQGVVRLNIVVAKTGEVTEIHLVSGHPALVPPAVEAVKHWRYAPTLLNGEPVEIKTTVDLNFTLSQ